MKREFIKQLGIEDETVIDKILDENSRDIGAEKAKTEAANTAKTDLETQLQQRDKDLKELQKAAEGNEALTKQVNDLQEAAKTAKADYDVKLKRAAVKADIGDTVHDTDLYMSLLDMAKVELDENGGIKAGLKEQREAIDKAKPFLLKASQQQDPKPAGYKPADGAKPLNNGEVNPFAKETLNLTAQGEMFKADPQKARQMAEIAGVTL